MNTSRLSSLLLPVVLFIGLLGAFALAPMVAAQSGTGISISPPFVEKNVTAGEVVRVDIVVTNEDTQEQELFLLTRDVIGLKNDGSLEFAEPGQRAGTEMSRWIQFLDDSLVIPGNSSTELTFGVVVPDNVSPGSHHSAVFLSREPADSAGGSGLGVGYQVGVLLNFEVDGDVVEAAQIRQFRTDKKFYNADATIGFTTRIINEGNTLIRPRGPIDVEDMFGKKFNVDILINDAGAGILPATERIFDATWTPEGFTFGKYTARLGLAYGDQVRRTITRELTFWILPMKIIIPGIIVGLFIIIALIFMIRSLFTKKRRPKKRRVRKRPRA